ncbi:multiprotein-bridging factor 1 family protein [Haloplanus sp. GCM10025708]|uniref:multiprotein-bridging factor 1 family protein n=1 Tax=Haloferacaceae TaxID=1644056 RepID=UPI00361E6BD2
MAKYSTGGGRSDDEGDSCELCGRETGSLRRANVAGANLLVCENCAPHGSQETSRGTSRETADDEPSREKRTAQKAAKMYDATRGDSSRWEEEGTDYEKDRLPYLVSNYGDRVEEARQEAGLTADELAAELDVAEDDVLAVEQGRAARSNVGGSVVRALEERLDVLLAEE